MAVDADRADSGSNFFPIYNPPATFASRLSVAGVPDVFVSQLTATPGVLLGTYPKAIIDYRVDGRRKLEHLRQRSRESGSIALRSQVVQYSLQAALTPTLLIDSLDASRGEFKLFCRDAEISTFDQRIMSTRFAGRQTVANPCGIRTTP
jgi:hypothetical protein